VELRRAQEVPRTAVGVIAAETTPRAERDRAGVFRHRENVVLAVGPPKKDGAENVVLKAPIPDGRDSPEKAGTAGGKSSIRPDRKRGALRFSGEAAMKAIAARALGGLGTQIKDPAAAVGTTSAVLRKRPRAVRGTNAGVMRRTGPGDATANLVRCGPARDIRAEPAGSAEENRSPARTV